MLSDNELEAEICDIDEKLESRSAWLTPRFRSGLLAARDVLVTVLNRRQAPWPGLVRQAPTPPPPPVRTRSAIRIVGQAGSAD